MSIVVDDDLFPYRAVARIEARWGASWFTGSGALVGRNDVLTASHVIYDFGRLADEIRVFPSYDPRADDNRYFSPAYANYFSTFDPDGDGLIVSGDGLGLRQSGAELDIALLSFRDPLGDDFGWFGARSDFTSGRVSVLGHPGRYDDVLTLDRGFARRYGVDDAIDISRLEINPGNSGGPIYVATRAGPVVVGVVSTGAAAASLSGHAWIFDEMRDNDRLLAGGATRATPQDAPPWYEALDPTRVGRKTGETLNGGARDDVIFGRGGRDRINGRSGDDVLAGGAGRDRLSGAAGDDTLIGGDGLDTLFGGSGFDTAVYWGARSDYGLRRAAAGHVVTFADGSSETLVSIEAIRFSDGILMLDI